LAHAAPEPHTTRKEPVMDESISFVGMDVHKKMHKIAMLLPGSEEPIEWAVANRPDAIHRMVRRVKKKAPGPVVFCYEAGVCGFALQRLIAAPGVECVVIAPSLMPIEPGRRVRTDRRDAAKLARLNRAGLLTAVRVPSEAEESIRDLCRARGAARADRTRARHRLTKLLLRRGLAFLDGKHWTEKHLRWLRGLRFALPVDQEVFNEYLGEIDHQDQRLRHLDELLRRAASAEPYGGLVGWLRCFRGIDTVTALSLVAELHGIEKGRFGHPRKLMAFLGLTPSEDSSGEKVRRGGITKSGNRHVRRLLIEASWSQRGVPRVSAALRKRREGQPAWVIRLADKAMRRLHRRYWRLVNAGKLPVKATTAVAREFSAFLWSLLYLQDKSVLADRPPRPSRRHQAQANGKGQSNGNGVSAAEVPTERPGRASARAFFAAAPAAGAAACQAGVRTS
jgi:transposase